MLFAHAMTFLCVYPKFPGSRFFDPISSLEIGVPPILKPPYIACQRNVALSCIPFSLYELQRGVPRETQQNP